MDLREVMEKKNFVVVGDTLNEEKYAYKIKQGLLKKGYHVACVGKELASINDVEGEIDVIDLCIHPAKGIRLIEECQKPFQCIVVQTGARSEELFALMKKKNLPNIEGCVLVGLRLYAGE